MVSLCSVCGGSGRLLDDACPLCDGAAFFHDCEAPFYIFLLAGQSNMVGRGNGAELDQALLDFINERADVQMAYDVDKSGHEQANATSGEEFLHLGRETQWSNGGQCYCHGPEWGLMQRLLERRVMKNVGSRRPRIYLIKFAMGSSTLHVQWAPNGQYFPEFIAFTKAMLRRVAQLEQARPRVDCLFWNQGNSDASGKAVERDSYQVNLVNFIHCVWKELEVSSVVPFPFVPLELHWTGDNIERSKTWKQYRKVNTAMHDACKQLGPAARLSTITQEMVLAIASQFLEDGHSGTGALLLEGQHLADTFADLLEL